MMRSDKLVQYSYVWLWEALVLWNSCSMWIEII